MSSLAFWILYATLFLIGIPALIITIAYFVIKKAVKKAILEAHQEIKQREP